MIPKNELGVIVYFAQTCGGFGWEITTIGSAFPDATISNIATGEILLAEFEYMASNFINHQHDPRECDVIICWENDSKKITLPVIEVSKPETYEVVPISFVEKDNLHLRLINARLKRELASNKRKPKRRRKKKNPLVDKLQPPKGDGWRIEIMRRGDFLYWSWRRGSREERECRYGGKVDDLPLDILEKYTERGSLVRDEVLAAKGS